MRKRLFRACYAVSAAAGITIALGLGAAGANASVTVHRATPQCAAYGGGTVHCVTWAEDDAGTLGLAITASGGFVNAPVDMTQNDTSNPMQDFLITDLGLVTTYYNFGSNDIGLNAYDNTEYPNDELVSAEFAPGGVPTDLCLGNVNDKLVLRNCNGLRWQTFIEATAVQYHCTSTTPEGVGPENDFLSGPGGDAPLSIQIPTGNVGSQAAPGDAGSLQDFSTTSYDCDDDGGATGTADVTPAPFAMLLSCAHVFDNGEHFAMTGSEIDGQQAIFWHPTQNNNQFWLPAVP